MTDRLAAAVAAAARSVPPGLLDLGATAVENRPGWSPAAAGALMEAAPAAGYRRQAEAVAGAWRTDPDISGAAVAVALRAAAAAVEAVRANQRDHLVWTGPPSPLSAGLRSTRSVLHTLVEQAMATLVLVSYVSFDVGDLVARLGAACDRGVDVSLVLETGADDHQLRGDPAAAFVALRGRARLYRWPAEQRRADFVPTARLHAKCVVADRARALITSANLTAAGINDNLELGVLLEAGPLPAHLHDHLAALIAQGTLAPV